MIEVRGTQRLLAMTALAVGLGGCNRLTDDSSLHFDFHLVATAGTDQHAIAGATLATLELTYEDHYNTPSTSTAPVTWTVSGGTLASASTSIDFTTGKTTNTWTLPSEIGVFKVTASTTDPQTGQPSSADFTATSAPKMVVIRGDLQQAFPSLPVAIDPEVGLVDVAGHPLSSADEVEWRVSAGGGFLDPGQSSPGAFDGNGRSHVHWTLGASGPQALSVDLTPRDPRVPPPPTVTITASLTAVPALPGTIVFVSGVGSPQIYSMTADGTNLTNLSQNVGALDDDPRWSFDGRRIVFTRVGPSQQSDIYAMDASGTGQTRLTTNTDSDDQPSWSPNSGQIVFHSTRAGVTGLYIMGAAGDGNPPTLMATGGSEPDWVLNSTRVAYRTSSTAGISITDPHCIGVACPHNLLPGSLPGDRAPVYSPDSAGTRIAFVRGGNIWIMNASDGSGQVQITTGDDDWPTWSPDGTMIAFSSRRNGCPSWRIYIVNVTSKAVLKQVPGGSCAPKNDIKPNWR